MRASRSPEHEPSAGAGGSSACPLIGLAHGSRHVGLRASIEGLMAAASDLGAMPTAHAYLDLAEPDLVTAVGALAAAGHRRAVVTPLLFTEAFHATVDVPEAVRHASAATGIELLLSDILGTGDDMLDVVCAGLRLAGVGPDASVLLAAVGSSDLAANQAVENLARRLADVRGHPVAAAFCTRAPRPASVLADLNPPVAVVPLFLSPGLLLDPLVALATERGMTMTAPLGALAAPVLVRRYRATLAQGGAAPSVADPDALRPVGDLR